MRKNHSKIVCIKLVHLPYLTHFISHKKKNQTFRGTTNVLSENYMKHKKRCACKMHLNVISSDAINNYNYSKGHAHGCHTFPIKCDLK